MRTGRTTKLWSTSDSLAYNAGKGKQADRVTVRDRTPEYKAQALRRHHERAEARQYVSHRACVYCGRWARLGTHPATCAYCSDLPGCEEL